MVSIAARTFDGPMPEDYILPDWLLPAQASVQCTSHFAIERSLILYNVVSFFLAILFATPLCFGFYKKAQHYILRQTFSAERVPLPSTRYRTSSTLIAVVGTVLITFLAPVAAGLVLRSQRDYGDVSLSLLIQQWAVRPRMTSIIFLFSAVSAYTKTKHSDTDKHPPNGFLITCVTGMLAEACIALLGAGFLLRQAQPAHPPSVNGTNGLPWDFATYTLMRSCAIAMLACSILISGEEEDNQFARYTDLVYGALDSGARVIRFELGAVAKPFETDIFTTVLH
ncbi:hypothetical protein LTS18_010093, partial [Coniosporium uncinatum]